MRKAGRIELHTGQGTNRFQDGATPRVVNLPNFAPIS